MVKDPRGHSDTLQDTEPDHPVLYTWLLQEMQENTSTPTPNSELTWVSELR